MAKVQRSCSVVVMLVLLLAGYAVAQMVSATLVGTVTDESGAVVPGATVTVTNTETNITRTVSTDGNGNYVVPNLPVGPYRIDVQKEGFRSVARTGLRLDVDQRARADISLQVGGAGEVVEVTGAPPMLRTESSELAEVVAQRQVEELPLNGRNFVQLVTLTSGTGYGVPGQSLHGNSPSAFRSNTAVNAHAGRADQNNFLLDGVDNNEADVNTIVIIPIVDGIQEFKVLTHNFSAEYGRSGGAIVSVQTKSGTNSLHGSLWEYHRNAALDAKNYFDLPGRIPKFIQNQFGGAIGGPIVRDRTFFFTDYQGTTVRQAQTFVVTVPTALMRAGNFTETGRPVFNPVRYIQSGGTIRERFDPNCAPVAPPGPPGMVVPACAIDPVAQALLAKMPLPNRPGLVNNYVAQPVMRRTDHQFDVRIDHHFNPKHTIFGRYSFGDVSRFQPSVLTGFFEGGGENFSGVAGPLSGSGNAKLRTQGLALNNTYIFSTNVVNETRVGYTRFALNNLPEGFGEDLAAAYGISGINVNPLTSGFPRLQIAGMAGFGAASFLPDISNQNMYQVVNNTTWVRGRHSIKFGVDYRNRQRNNYEAFNQQGVFLFTGANTTQAFADFLTGWPTTTIRTLLAGKYYKRSWELAEYIQNDITVTRRFKLNLGLRHEMFAPLKEKHNRQSNFDTTTANMIVASDPGVLENEALRRFNKWNFMPRVGFAYDLTGNGNTVLRGGYGLSYLEDGGQVVTMNIANNFPFSVTQAFTLATGLRRLSQGLPVPTVPAATLRPAGNVIGVDPDFKPARVHMWNLNIQQQITPTMVVDLAYAGSEAVNQRTTWNINAPVPAPGMSPGNAQSRRPFFSLNPGLQNVTVSHSLGWANYHSFQAKLQRRFGTGLNFLGTYTWSKSMSDSEGALGTCGDAGPNRPGDLDFERSVSCTHIPHRFVFSATYPLPFFRNAEGLAGTLLGGWQINGITLMRAGSPFTPSVTTQNAAGYTGRGDMVCDGRLDNPTVQRWFNTQCWQPASPAFNASDPFSVYGNARRNPLRGPAQYNTDFSVFKNFRVTERTNVQFRTEVFNLFNTPQFGVPVRTMEKQLVNGEWLDSAASNAGTITHTINSARQIQFALRLTF